MLKHIFTVKIASYSFTGKKINTDSNAGCVFYVLNGTTLEKLVVRNSSLLVQFCKQFKLGIFFLYTSAGYTLF